jgi:GNAT superfamily N-acetyltransferase
MSADWRIERRGASDASVQAMVVAYIDELLGGVLPDFDPEQAAPPSPDDFEWPNGSFLLVFAGEEPIACGALRRLSEGVGELRRMWVTPTWRGRHVGRYLLDALEDLAQEMQMSELRLDTNRGLRPAEELYRSAGYREVPRYNDNGFADIWFAKRL